MITRADHCPASRQCGFTLIEILLVAAILAMMSAVMAPRMNRAFRGLELRGTARDIDATIALACIHAIQQRMETDLVVAADGRSYWLEADDPDAERATFKQLGRGPLDGGRVLPREMRIEVEGIAATEKGKGESRLRFFPNGERTKGRLKLTDRRQRSCWLVLGEAMGTTRIYWSDPDHDES